MAYPLLFHTNETMPLAVRHCNVFTLFVNMKRHFQQLLRCITLGRIVRIVKIETNVWPKSSGENKTSEKPYLPGGAYTPNKTKRPEDSISRGGRDKNRERSNAAVAFVSQGNRGGRRVSRWRTRKAWGVRGVSCWGGGRGEGRRGGGASERGTISRNDAGRNEGMNRRS